MGAPILPCHCCGASYKRLELRVFEWFQAHPGVHLSTRILAEQFGAKRYGITTMLRSLVLSGHLSVRRTFDYEEDAWCNEYSLGPKAREEMVA